MNMTYLTRLRDALPFALILFLVPPAAAQSRTDSPPTIQEARFDTLSRQNREALHPLLLQGPVAFVGFRNTHELPTIVLATYVDASPNCISRVLTDPARFPRFIDGLHSTTIESRDELETTYGWTWQIGFLRMHGRSSVMAIPTQTSRRGSLVSMQVLDGDLGEGRMSWRAYPRPEGKSLLVFSSRLDMRDANYLTRQMSVGGNSVNRSINISLAYVMMMSVKEEAQRRLGDRDDDAPRADEGLGDLREPDVDLRALAPLLARGDVAAVDLRDGPLYPVSVFSRTWRAPQVIWPIMTNPESFGRSLIQGSRAEVLSRSPQGSTFAWSIPIPLVGSEGQMELAHTSDSVNVRGISGHLQESRWNFRLHTLPWGEAAIVGWSRFDPGDASWMLETLVRDTRHFREGIALAGKIMIVRSLRSRAWGR